MDRNQAIGLALIAAIMMGYFIFFGNQQEQNKKVEKTTTIKVESSDADTISNKASVDSAALKEKFGGFASAAQGESKSESLSNDDLQITFNSKGGVIEKVLLKKYKTDDHRPLYIID